MSEPIDGDALIADIKPVLKQHRVQICLRPDLVSEWENKDAQLQELLAKPAGSGRLAGEGSPPAAAKKLAREITALEADIEKASVWFTYRGLPSDKFRALCAKNPPREKNQFDMLLGYDQDAVAEILMSPAREGKDEYGCLIDPVFSDEGWAGLIPKIGPSEWQELRDGAFEANGATKTDPKSVTASSVLSRRGSASA